MTAAGGGGLGSGQIAWVVHGAAGWLAVGDATSGAAAATPVVLGSADGRTWTAVGGAGTGAGTFAGAGRIVTAAVAAGGAGYVIVGHASVGARTVAAAWYAPNLTDWRRATDARAGALDGHGTRMMSAVTATSRGFAAVGAVGARPAAWLSGAGRAWTLVRLPLPAGAASAGLDYVAANGRTVAAVGTEVTAAGQRRPFDAVSTDAGATWTLALLPAPRREHHDLGRVGHRADSGGRGVHRDRHLRRARPDRRRRLDAARRRGRGNRVDRGGAPGSRPVPRRHAGDHRAHGDR